MDPMVYLSSQLPSQEELPIFDKKPSGSGRTRLTKVTQFHGGSLRASAWLVEPPQWNQAKHELLGRLRYIGYIGYI